VAYVRYSVEAAFYTVLVFLFILLTYYSERNIIPFPLSLQQNLPTSWKTLRNGLQIVRPTNNISVTVHMQFWVDLK
jgi:hypothetical protein